MDITIQEKYNFSYNYKNKFTVKKDHSLGVNTRTTINFNKNENNDEIWFFGGSTPRMFVYLGNGFLLILPISVGLTTGYISTLHEDHLHRREEHRKNGWPTSIIVIIAVIAISGPFLRENLIFENLSLGIRTGIIALPFMLALFRMTSWWKQELIPEKESSHMQSL